MNNQNNAKKSKDVSEKEMLVKDYLNPKTEDLVHEKRMLIINLNRIIGREFDEMFELIWKDIQENADDKDSLNKSKINDFFFDYMLNDENLVSFEEYLDSFNYSIEKKIKKRHENWTQ